MQSPAAPREQKQSVQEHFGPAAARYAIASVHRAGADLEALVRAVVAVAEGRERALDVGSGAGHTALALAPHVARVEALDLTRAMLEQVERLAAERGLANVTTRLGDAEALPYPDASFEIASCRLCAHHFQRPALAVREMFRVLVPGGRLLLVDIVAAEEPEVDTFLNAIEIVRDPSHVRDHSISQWRGLLAAAGFEIEAVESYPMRIDFEAWLTRIGAPAEAAAALRWMFAQATHEARAALEIDEKLDFTLENAVFRARKPR